MSEVLALPLTELPVGQLRRVIVDGQPICLARTGGLEVHAIADTCTHEGYSLAEGELIDDEIECPQHSSRFDLATGRPTSLPATVPARIYSARIHDSAVYVETEPKNEGEEDSRSDR